MRNEHLYIQTFIHRLYIQTIAGEVNYVIRVMNERAAVFCGTTMLSQYLKLVES
jgi:hypothetical protein